MLKAKICTSCNEYKDCHDSFSSWIFFIIGIIATVAIRVVTVLIHLDPIYAKIAWYIGVTGFFVFFVYKFRVAQARTRAINKVKLIDKINTRSKLADEDYKILESVLCGINSRKERINYFLIFGLSAVALLLAVYMDFFK